jgi:hypothetical protein
MKLSAARNANDGNLRLQSETAQNNTKTAADFAIRIFGAAGDRSHTSRTKTMGMEWSFLAARRLKSGASNIQPQKEFDDENS